MTYKDKHFTWMVGGEAGYGITTMGQMFSRACTESGLQVFGYVEYPSLIRGGHNTAMVRVGEGNVYAHSNTVDMLLALNRESVDLHLDEMAENGVIIYDGESVQLDATKIRGDILLASVPFARITKELGAQILMRNTVAFGASFGIMNYDFKYIERLLNTTFGRKGQEIVDFNIKVARAGYDYAQQNYMNAVPRADGGTGKFAKSVKAIAGENTRIVLSGNEAIAMGAIKAGLKFMAAYPMTPVTSIMLMIAKYGEKYGIVMKHTEDEIAAINMTIGAAHAGVRSMTATAGGGFSLMVEALGMAGITETPIVVVEGMRPGPSTGLPTWTDQADLRFLMHASQGEFPRVIALPGDVGECFYMTLKAFNLAEKYQMISMILTDKYLGESVMTTERFNHKDYKPDRGLLMTREEAEKITPGTYKRFEFTESGVSRRAVPGMPNTIYAMSTDEHKEDGDLDESGENRIKMVDKRAKKLVTLRKESLPDSEMIELHGPADADLTIVSWGSTKGIILEAIEHAAEQGQKVNFLQIKYVLPFPTEPVEKILRAAKKTLLIETNFDGQMGGVITENTGILLKNKFLRYDGRPFHPAQIVERINLELNV